MALLPHRLNEEVNILHFSERVGFKSDFFQSMYAMFCLVNQPAKPPYSWIPIPCSSWSITASTWLLLEMAVSYRALRSVEVLVSMSGYNSNTCRGCSCDSLHEHFARTNHRSLPDTFHCRLVLIAEHLYLSLSSENAQSVMTCESCT